MVPDFTTAVFRVINSRDLVTSGHPRRGKVEKVSRRRFSVAIHVWEFPQRCLHQKSATAAMSVGG